jgi:hypothetical protein
MNAPSVLDIREAADLVLERLWSFESCGFVSSVSPRFVHRFCWLSP